MTFLAPLHAVNNSSPGSRINQSNVTGGTRGSGINSTDSTGQSFKDLVLNSATKDSKLESSLIKPEFKLVFDLLKLPPDKLKKQLSKLNRDELMELKTLLAAFWFDILPQFTGEVHGKMGALKTEELKQKISQLGEMVNKLLNQRSNQKVMVTGENETSDQKTDSMPGKTSLGAKETGLNNGEGNKTTIQGNSKQPETDTEKILNGIKSDGKNKLNISETEKLDIQKSNNTEKASHNVKARDNQGNKQGKTLQFKFEMDNKQNNFNFNDSLDNRVTDENKNIINRLLSSKADGQNRVNPGFAGNNSDSGVRDMNSFTGSYSPLFMPETGSENQSKVEHSAVTANRYEFINQIVDQLRVINRGNKNELEFQLEPRFLGKVKFNLKVEAGEVIARLMVENQYVKGMLEQNIHTLKTNLTNQGLNVENIYIETADSNEDTGSHQYSQQQEQNRDENRQPGKNYFNGEELARSGDLSPEELERLREYLPRWSSLGYYLHRMDLLA
ncbi:flagellar hook-length control protein [Halothermothrix orenii H 168]|uniref:Flagellar hook-length control protein n=2 Tax=Halothermothrix orenii TaxID=31909 RepID=B8CYR4_HALOH|nr:flagellar hook-length control protein [Halothermothrix orenii H 168]